MRWRWTHDDAGQAWSGWPALLIVLGVVLVPTACVLWFMTEAVRNERMAVRQKLAAVYRQSLDACQRRVEAYWQQVEQALVSDPTLTPPEAFQALVESKLVDSALIYRDGSLAYPLLAQTPDERLSLSPGTPGEGRDEGAPLNSPRARATRPDIPHNSAVALQADARRLVRAGETEQAIELLATILQQDEFRDSRDAAGRLIAPDAALYAIQLLTEEDPRRPPLVQALARRLRDYTGPPMPSTQRLFLIGELAARTGEVFATMTAESIALELLEQSGDGITRSTPGRGLSRHPDARRIVMLASSSGETVALWRESQLTEILGFVIRPDQPADTTIYFQHDTTAWAAPDAFLAVPAGRHMPGWFMVLQLTGPDPFAAAAERHEAAYRWTAGTGVAAIAVLGIVMGLYLRRQMRLTRLKNDLTATVSHELKTPLASMRVLVDTLVEGRCRNADQEKDYLRLIARENARLSRLIDNFLTFSRMERNRNSFDFRPVDVAQAALEALEAIGDRAQNVRADLAGPLPPVKADRDALVTVIVNLLDNAWKYSTDARPIDLRAAPDAGGVAIAVHDRGIGIARRHHRRIFRRFYQVDQRLSRRASGCGLGLSIVQFIVDAHRGRVTVQSQPGRGATFTVWLPSAESIPAESGYHQ